MHLIHCNSGIPAEFADSLPGMYKLSFFFRLFPMFNNITLIDRTEMIRTPIDTKNICPIPSFKLFKKTYEDICNERAQELLMLSEKLAVPLYIFYSGGIDSTVLLTSFIKNASLDQMKNIVVLMSQESIDEYPKFYEEHIHRKLRTQSSAMFPYLLGSDGVITSGHLNDQLLGIGQTYKLMRMFDPDIIHKPYSRETFFSFFSHRVPDETMVNFYLDLFERLIRSAPVEIRTNIDYLWWINFSLRWQSLYLRIPRAAPKRIAHKVTLEYVQTRFFPFFAHDDFQLWSMNNLDKRIKDTWSSYKWVCKDLIYDFTKDADYRDKKLKQGSMPHIMPPKEAFNFIDDSMHFYEHLEPSEFYIPDNDFV